MTPETAFALSGAEAQATLAHLGRARAKPDIALLVSLVRAYTERVPWESASRIARRAAPPAAVRPRWPGEFWREARTLGTGGTCFESNAAFAALLRALGYDCYSTINDMGREVGVHTAIVVRLGNTKWLTDVGFPLYAPLPFAPERASTTRSPFHTYTATPQGREVYAITRDRHPNPDCFTFRDRVISDNEYRLATVRDYGPRGLFLDRVILMKVIEGRIWRFDSAAGRELRSFRGGEETKHPLPEGASDAGDAADALAHRFGMDASTIRAALAAVNFA